MLWAAGNEGLASCLVMNVFGLSPYESHNMRSAVAKCRAESVQVPYEAGPWMKSSGRYGSGAASRTLFTAYHGGSQTGCPIGSMSHEQDSSRPLRRSLATR